MAQNQTNRGFISNMYEILDAYKYFWILLHFSNHSYDGFQKTRKITPMKKDLIQVSTSCFCQYYTLAFIITPSKFCLARHHNARVHTPLSSDSWILVRRPTEDQTIIIENAKFIKT